MEVVINSCFGGFSLSHKAIMRYAELKGFKLYPWLDDITKNVYKVTTVEEYLAKEVRGCLHYSKSNDIEKHDSTYFSDRSIPRDDVHLVQIVKELGKKVNGACTNLTVVEIPDDVTYEIAEYDGNEHIAEQHRTWY